MTSAACLSHLNQGLVYYLLVEIILTRWENLSSSTSAILAIIIKSLSIICCMLVVIVECEVWCTIWNGWFILCWKLDVLHRESWSGWHYLKLVSKLLICSRCKPWSHQSWRAWVLGIALVAILYDKQGRHLLVLTNF